MGPMRRGPTVVRKTERQTWTQIIVKIKVLKKSPPYISTLYNLIIAQLKRQNMAVKVIQTEDLGFEPHQEEMRTKMERIFDDNSFCCKC